ncbi:hypothetical protein [Neobacillus soli]|nr:hypothetical protein [Neobacillus soli]
MGTFDIRYISKSEQVELIYQNGKTDVLASVLRQALIIENVVWFKERNHH